MIKLNKLSKNMIQVLGTHEGISVSGYAYRVPVIGSSKRVWQYALSLLRGPVLVTVNSHPAEGTMTNEELLLKRIVRVCNEFEEEEEK